MNPFSLPTEFLQKHPRFKNFMLSPLPRAEAPNAKVTVTIGSINIVFPSDAEPSAYASIVQNTLILTTNPEFPVEIVGGDSHVGGAQITASEALALPGAVEFLTAVQQLLMEKWVASLNSTP